MNLILNIPILLSIFLLSLKNQLIWAQNRIIGGSEIKITEAPYMLHMTIPRIHSHKASVCGAGIISNEWAVTAAHCFLNPDKDVNHIRVLAGTADTERRARTAKTYHVSQYIQHENFTGIGSDDSVGYDIAVIKISPPLKFNKATKPLKLPKKGEKIKVDMATIAGWGKTDPQGGVSTKLRHIRVPLVKTSKCKEEYRHHHMKVKSDQICYGFHNKTTTLDKCQGDSGGPLVNDDGIVLGVVSQGVKCGTHGLPGIYTSVPFFRDWVKEKTGV
ncbi:trypsin-1-like isoform X1 [Leptopilina boulardi]|uniref:trypsin-1-like isoform X1 n=1 Tax=Leptopilina boulardi TaxID=63433 RepID=UPI0021F62F34|nr:trypsin-1-like isoform X1 [Leptopilina boulardi]